MKAYTLPHYRQSHCWQRFARMLREVRNYAWERKEDALTWCFEKRTHGFTIPLALENASRDTRGLRTLRRRLKSSERFPEAELRQRYNETTDEVEVEVVIHERTRTKIERIPIGRLPEKDAAWVRPLLREYLDLGAFITDVQQTGGISYHTGLEVQVAISRPDRPARDWTDVYDDRKQQQAECWSLEAAPVTACDEGPYASPQSESKVQVVAEPSVEDWLREDIERRETCLSDLPAKDYWQVAPLL